MKSSTKIGKQLAMHHQAGQLLTPEVLTQAAAVGKSNAQLASELGVNYGTVAYHRNQLGVESAHSRRDAGIEVMRNQPIAPDVLGAVVGTLMGDASIVTKEAMRRKLGYLCLSHCAAQREWLEYKHKRLASIVSAPVQVLHNRWGVYKDNPQLTYRCTSIGHPVLYDLRQLAYGPGGHKHVTRKLLDMVTEEGLAWWYYDDGCAIRAKHTRQTSHYQLATYGFTFEENNLIRSWLHKRFAIKTTVLRFQPKETCYWYLYFARDTRDKLTAILEKYPVACLDYKVIRSSETTRETPPVGG